MTAAKRHVFYRTAAITKAERDLLVALLEAYEPDPDDYKNVAAKTDVLSMLANAERVLVERP